MQYLMSKNEITTNREHLKICMIGLQVNLQVFNLQAIYLAPQIANESLVAAVRQLAELVEAQGQKLDKALKQKALGYVSQAMSLYSASLDGSYDRSRSALAVEEWLVEIRDHSTTESTNEAVSVPDIQDLSSLGTPFDSAGQSSIEVASNFTSQRSNPFDSGSQGSSQDDTASISTTKAMPKNPSKILIDSNYLVSKVVWSQDNSTMAIAGERLFPEQKIEHGVFYGLPFTREVSLDCACIGVYKTGSATLFRQLDAPCRAVQTLALNDTGTLVVYGWILLSFRACFEVRNIETGDLVRRQELFEGNPSQGLNIDLAFASIEPYLIAVLNCPPALPKSVVINIETSRTMKRYAWEEAQWALILGSVVCVRSGSKLIHYDPITGGILSSLTDKRIQKLKPLRHHLALSGESLAIFYAAEQVLMVYNLRTSLTTDAIRLGNVSERSSLTYNGSKVLTTLMNHGQEWRLGKYENHKSTIFKIAGSLENNKSPVFKVAGSLIQNLSHDAAYIYYLVPDCEHGKTWIWIRDTETLLPRP